MRFGMIAALCLLPTTLMAADEDLIKAGEKVFRKCKACHKIGEGAVNGVGPALNNIIGQPAGAIAEFKYSPAMLDAGESGVIWDEVALTAFLTKPRDFIPGTKMTFNGLRKPDDVKAVIELLKAQTAPE